MIWHEILSDLTLVIFLFKGILKKCFHFFALASRCGFGAAISDAVARSSSACCNSASADHIVMAASQLLGAAAACGVRNTIVTCLLQLDIVNRNGMAASKAAIVICHEILFKFMDSNLCYIANPERSQFE